MLPPIDRFASHLLHDLTATDPRAAHLKSKVRGKAVTIGIDEGDKWIPLLRLSTPSASCNVMNLDVRHGRGWAPTFERGTPAALAEQLLGPLLFTWADEVDAVLAWRETSEQRH